jgi:hypothetical protein
MKPSSWIMLAHDPKSWLVDRWVAWQLVKSEWLGVCLTRTTENRACMSLLGHLPKIHGFEKDGQRYSCLASKQTVLPRAIRTALHPEYRSATTTNRTSGNWIAFRRVFVWIVSLQYSKHDLKSRSQYWQRWQEEVVSIKPSPSNFRKDLPYIFSLRG